MSEAILGHPFSGALYAYFADELQGSSSHTQSTSSYYKTLYGTNYEKYVELALNFLLLYRNAWITLADNPLPLTPLSPEDRTSVPELGLSIGYYESTEEGDSYQQRRENLRRLASDPRVATLLGRTLKIPKHAWELILDSAVYEAILSAQKRVPLLCSRGRRVLIRYLVDIDRPSLHPLLPELHHVSFIESYRELTGLALRPRNLDDLIAIKFDPGVRKYGDSFLEIAHSETLVNPRATAFRVAQLIRESIETEAVEKRFSGALNWIGKFSRIFNEPSLAVVSGIGSRLADHNADQAGWYAFAGSIDSAIKTNQLIRKVDQTIQIGMQDA